MALYVLMMWNKCVVAPSMVLVGNINIDDSSLPRKMSLRVFIKIIITGFNGVDRLSRMYGNEWKTVINESMVPIGPLKWINNFYYYWEYQK